MKRTELRNKFLKYKTVESRQVYQCNFCVSLLRKSKRNCYSNLNMKGITGNKNYWKTIKPLFFDKTESAGSITLKENKKITENQNEVANIFNNYFSKVASPLQVPESSNINPKSERVPCPTLKLIMKYRRYPSITAIKYAYKRSSFSFSTVDKVDVIREIKKLNKKKAILNDSISFKISKENVNFFAEFILIFYNNAITTSKFSSFMKMANVIPIFKKGSKSKKKSFRPVTSSVRNFRKISD